LIYLISVSSASEDTSQEAGELTNVTLLGQQKLSDHVRLILNHYKQKDPVGLPGSPVSDPMPIPDMKHSFTYATMHFKSAHVHGLSRFRIQHIKSNLAAMQVCTPVCIRYAKCKGIGQCWVVGLVPLPDEQSPLSI